MSGAALLCLLLPTHAGAAQELELGFADPLYHSPDPLERATVLDQSLAAGASYARIIISWKAVAPRKPLDAQNPADLAYRFSRLDEQISDAAARGLQVLLTIHNAPAWAERAKELDEPYPAPPGTAYPDSRELRDFAKALATRYSGSYSPLLELGAPPLPRVSLYEAWNEPNLNGFLSPQWINDRPYSHKVYVRLLNGVYRGVHAVQPDATVIAGATGPFGRGGAEFGRQVKPLEFLRRLFCLRGRKRLEATPCERKARFDLLSHHPISPLWKPRRGAHHPDNVTIPEMGRVRRTLRAAERQGTVLPAGPKREVWATEFWWETEPPASWYGKAPTERGQARNFADALRLLSRQRIPVGLMFQIQDDPEVDGPPRTGWGSGLRFADGSKKLSWRAVRFPLVADRTARRRIRVWTRAPRTGTLEIEATTKRGKLTLLTLPVEAGEVVVESFRLEGRARLRAKLDGLRSLGWKVPNDRITD